MPVFVVSISSGPELLDADSTSEVNLDTGFVFVLKH